jgi:predicted DNA-binding ribbon-helix-helix protein
VRKRSLSIAGHRTSLALEDAFWDGLEAMAEARGEPITKLIAEIDATRATPSLSSAVRLSVLAFYRDQNPKR